MYNYEEQKQTLFTDKGQRLFIVIRDSVKQKIKLSGAVTMLRAMELPAGTGAADSWEMMACVDRMIELEELREIPANGAGQDRIFVGV